MRKVPSFPDIVKHMRELKREDWGAMITLMLIGALYFSYPGAAYMEGHSLAIHQDALNLVQRGELPLTSPMILGGLGPYGPIQTYLLSIFYILFPSYYSFVFFHGFLNLGTAYLFIRMGRMLHDIRTGVLSALLFSFSSFAFLFAVDGFSSHLTPFFATILFYSLTRLLIDRRRLHLPIAMGALATLLQLHHTAFVALPLAVIIIYYVLRTADSLRRWVPAITIGLAVFLLLFLPSLAHEVQNDFADTKRRASFLLGQTQPLGADFGDSSLPASMGQKVRLYLALDASVNPFAFSWRRICSRGPHATSPPLISTLSGYHWAFQRVIHPISIGAVLYALFLLTLRRERLTRERKLFYIVMLLWLSTGFLLYILIPAKSASPSHATYFFPPLILLLAAAATDLVRRPEYGRIPRVILSTAVLFFVLGGGFAFLHDKATMTQRCLQQNSELPLEIMYDLQRGLTQDTGTLPPTIIYVNYSTYPLRVPLRAPEKWEPYPGAKRVLLIQDSYHPGVCFGDPIQSGWDGFHLLPAPPQESAPSFLLHMEHEDGWESARHDDLQWIRAELDERSMGRAHLAFVGYSPNFAHTVETISQREIFVRMRFDEGDLPLGEGKPYLFLFNNGYGIERISEVYFDGEMLYNSSTDSKGTLPMQTAHFELAGFADARTHVAAVRVLPEDNSELSMEAFVLLGRDCPKAIKEGVSG